jgi:hypothetical protein
MVGRPRRPLMAVRTTHPAPAGTRSTSTAGVTISTSMRCSTVSRSGTTHPSSRPIARNCPAVPLAGDWKGDRRGDVESSSATRVPVSSRRGCRTGTGTVTDAPTSRCATWFACLVPAGFRWFHRHPHVGTHRRSACHRGLEWKRGHGSRRLGPRDRDILHAVSRRSHCAVGLRTTPLTAQLLPRGRDGGWAM